MRSNNKIWILLIIVFLNFPEIFSQNYGLKFSGHEVSKDSRTGLNLNPNRAFTFNDDFELSFDILIEPKNKFIYGYIFRVFFDDIPNFDFVYSPRNQRNDNFSLIHDGSTPNISFNFDDDSYLGQWINIKVKFNLKENSLQLINSDSTYSIENLKFKKKENVKVIFGVCNYDHNISTDVPPMAIKNVQLFSRDKLKYEWLLNDLSKEISYDRINKWEARAMNPNWINSNYQYWLNVDEFDLEGNTLTAVNQDESLLYLIGDKKMLIFNVLDRAADTIIYDLPTKIHAGNQAVYNKKDNTILIWSIDSKMVSSFDFKEKHFTPDHIEQANYTQYWHHNKYLDSENQRLYFFGGYGRHTYKNYIWEYDIEKEVFSELDYISKELYNPRYLAAAGGGNDTVFIIGGFGSPSEKQILNPKHYYDLIAFSVKEKSFTKIRELPIPEEDFSFTNSIVFDSSDRSFYTLIFQEYKYKSYLQLIKGYLNKPGIEYLADSIPYLFHDIHSYSDIYFFQDLNELYVVTTLSDENENTRINLYSVKSPPNPSKVFKEEEKFNFSILYWVLAILILFSGFFYILRKVKIKTGSRIKEIQNKDTKFDSLREFSSENIYEGSENINKNSFHFFGGFQVFNKNTEDITKDFTPLLKELFLLIFLNTIKDDKGISSEKIIEIIWFDKSYQNGKNNLGVNMGKLKTLLSELDSIELSRKTSYWKVIFDESIIYSDYLRVLQVIKCQVELNDKIISELIDFTLKGSFLFNLNYEWLDEFKAYIGDKIVDSFLSYAENQDINEKSELIIRIADCISNFDKVNEDAMILKCKAQYSMGRHSMAKNTYQKFFDEYKQLYDEVFAKSFKEIRE